MEYGIHGILYGFCLPNSKENKSNTESYTIYQAHTTSKAILTNNISISHNPSTSYHQARTWSFQSWFLATSSNYFEYTSKVLKNNLPPQFWPQQRQGFWGLRHLNTTTMVAAFVHNFPQYQWSQWRWNHNRNCNFKPCNQDSRNCRGDQFHKHGYELYPIHNKNQTHGHKLFNSKPFPQSQSL